MSDDGLLGRAELERAFAALGDKNVCVTEWHEIHSFETISGYLELRRRVDAAVFDGILVSIPVRQPYADVGLNEQWYEELSGERWRLIEPDFPFKGLFEMIAD